MKKLLIIVSILFLMMSCAAYNRIPDGKTDADWEKDEQYCIDKAGKITGFMAANPIAFVINFGGANQRYNRCVKELGWTE